MGEERKKEENRAERTGAEERNGVEPEMEPSGSSEALGPPLKKEGSEAAEQDADEEVKGEETESQPTAREEKTEPQAEMEESKAAEAAEGEEVISSWEKDLAVYPLRDPKEDPRWAIRTVKIWIGFTLLSLVFILTLLVLGAIYD